MNELRVSPGRRFWSFMIDWGLLTYALAAAVYFFRRPIAQQPPVLFGVTLSAGALYALAVVVGFELAGLIRNLGQSPGRALLGLRLRQVDGGRLSFGKRILRWLAWNVGLIPAAFGSLRILWRPDGLAWHDEIARSRMVDDSTLRDDPRFASVVPWFRRLTGWVSLIILLETLVVGWQVTEVDVFRLVTRAGNIQNVTRFLVRPDWSVAGRVIDGLIETVYLALMSTAFAVPFAFAFSFLAARNLMLPVRARLDGLLGAGLGAVGGLWVAGELAGRMASAGMLGGAFTISLGGIVLRIVGLLLGASLLGRLLNHLPARIGASPARAVSAVLGAIVGLGVSRLIVDWTVTLALGSDWAEFFGVFPAISIVALALGALLLGFDAWRRGPDDQFPIGRVVYYVVRTVLNITRSIEPLIWAIVFVVWVRVGPFPGMLALTVHSIASLAKLYSEQVETIDPGPVEAIQATGANALQTIVYAVIPQVIPPYTAFTIYRWDINVRMSTIIGMVGGGGIGQRLQQAMNLGQWRDAGLIIVLIVAVVMSLDFASAKVRERIV